MLIFNLQRFAGVEHGTNGNDQLSNFNNNSQTYGLSGDDSITAQGTNLILIGGSGNDTLHVRAGRVTLNGDPGADTFSFNYQSDAAIEALIEDINPAIDSLIVNYVGDNVPSLSYTVDEINVWGNIRRNLILTDADGNLNITLQGTAPLDDYYDQEGNEFLWDVLRLANEEREKVNDAPLTFSQDIMNSADVRANELIELYSHTRPDGSSCFTALEHGGSYVAENIAVGYTSSSAVMTGWMNSSGHRANILNSVLSRFGVGYVYEADSDWGHHWVQMFRTYEYSDETLERDEFLSTRLQLTNGSASTTLTLNEITPESTVTPAEDAELIVTLGGMVYDAGDGNDLIINGQYFSHGASDTTLLGGAGKDTITNHGSNSVLLGGAGNDEIHNGYHYYQPWNVYYETNPAGDENNDAFNGSNVSIDGGDGNDLIINIGANVTVRGGAGSDTVNHAAHYIYAAGDGNDLITAYSSDDTIHLIGSGIDSSMNSYSDVILNVGSGAITLRNAADIALNVVVDAAPSIDNGINVGEGSYLFDESTGANDDPIEVYYYRPSTWQSGDSIAFVFHGMDRIATDYRRAWERYADDNNLLIVCPEFTNEKYPGSRYYNTGNVTDNSGNLQPESDWIFDVVDRIIVDIKERVDSADSKVITFGHSAGAQMVHRYALFDEESESDLIIAANAGWYTMPDKSIDFPYGIDGVNFSDEQLRRAFAKDVVIMLGEEDTLRSDDLRQTAEADAQGLNRYERGQKFFETSRAKAEELGATFNWKLETVPNIGHSNGGMAQAAIGVYNDWLLASNDDDSVDEDDTSASNDDTLGSDDTSTVGDDTLGGDDNSTVGDDTLGSDDTSTSNDDTLGDDDTSTSNDDTLGSDDTSTVGDDTLGSDDTSTVDDNTLGGDDTSTSNDDTLGDDDTSTADDDTLGSDDTSTVGDNTLGSDDTSTVGDDTLGSDDTSTVDDDTLGGDDTSTVGDNTLGGDDTSTAGDDTLGSDDTSTVGDDTLGSDDTSIEIDNTMVGGASNDILYGTSDADVFVYSVGGGRDAVGDKHNAVTLYYADDKAVILGNGVSRDSIVLKDKRDVLTVTFKDDKRSRLTLNRADSLEAVRFYFGNDLTSALESEPFIYGASDDVSVNAKGTRLNVLPTVENATVDASEINSTAKTLDGSAADGELYLIGNGNANVIVASNYGSTLEGGWNSAKDKGTNDKLYGGSGADTFIYDGRSKDVIYNYGAEDRIVIDGEFDKVKVSGRNVILHSGKNKLTVKNALGETITITDGTGQTSTYEFTRTNKDFDSARIDSSTQMPTDEYWFEPDDRETDQLSSILDAPVLDSAVEHSYESNSFTSTLSIRYTPNYFRSKLIHATGGRSDS